MSSKMYCNWSSFCLLLQNYQSNHRSVLSSLPLSPEAAKDVTKMVVSCIGKNTSLKINTEKEVDWCMEVIAYGLGLPLSENDTLRECVNIYCDWLSTLLPQPKANIPLPLLTLPNHFSRKMLSHLYSLFIPRTGDSAPDMVNRQAVLCHRVLRMIQSLVLESSILEEETWDCLLLLLLAINNSLLSPPIISNDIGDQLCERIVSVLLEVWLQSCIKVYPTPRMWKTLTEFAQTWRHRKSLITLWNKVNLSLLIRLSVDLYGPSTRNNIDDVNLMSIPPSLSGELLAQTWYRLLHFIGNPIQLAKRQVVGHKFLQNVIVPSQMGDPIQSCSAYLPNIFFEAMRGIAALVDTLLGIPTCHGRDSRSSVNLTHCSINLTDSKAHLLPAPYRARCNSLLHLFGSWLFEAALLDCETLQTSKVNVADRSRASSVSFTTETFANRPRNDDPRDRPRSSTVVEANDSLSVFPVDDYENGKAEAIGVLCKIFCSKKTEEEILPQYLARFYASLLHGLRLKEDKVCGFYVTSCIYQILLNSVDLLRIDLDGVFIILPSLIDALEVVLTYKDVKLQPNMNRAELRRASIHVLISIISTPLNFHQLSLKEFPSGSPGERNSMMTTFSHLRPRLTQIILSTLSIETDSVNTHLLLGALATYILDFALFERTDQIPISSQEYISVHVQYDSSANVVSSSSDTHSCHSASSTSYPSMGDNNIDQSSFNDRMSYTASQSTCSLQGLVNASIQLVSHKLLSLWKTDLNVSLAALEMLTSLSNIGIFNKMDEIRRVIRVLCDYITLQCSRPPPHHSKDLHSTIVAAFSCCASWLFSHPDLVTDFDCLSAVLQVIELGISGSKSQVKGSNDILLKKHEKDLKPVSLRVRDAAELLLTCLIEEIGSVPTSCSSQSLRLIDENVLLRASGKETTKSNLKLDTNLFRFFASEGTVYSILENGQDSEPAITILLRNAYGRQLWTSQMRHLPRHKCGVRLHNNINPGRPLPMNDFGIQYKLDMQNFPDSIDRVRPCLADKSIPHLDNVMVDIEDGSSIELDELNRLVEASLTNNFSAEIGRSSKTKVECSLPSFCTKFQTARLFLSHLGFLPFESLKDHSLGRGTNALIGLDSNPASFAEDLELLDRIERLTRDTVHVFYQRAGQKNVAEILSNTKSILSLDSNFLEFLQSLGWQSDASNHSLATEKDNAYETPTAGKIERSFTPASHDEEHRQELNPDNLINTQVLFWADGFSEIVFVWPDPFYWESSSSLANRNRSPQQKLIDRKPHIIEEADSNFQRPADKRSNKQLCTEINMIVVWLESFEDLNCFPLRELVTSATGSHPASDVKVRLNESIAECFIIFIHALKSGLYRIHLRGKNCATPLIDGIVVSRRVLGPLVRQTALNMAKRRRLDHDSYQLPHVQRKIKIAEMISRYTTSVDTPTFYSDLFVSSEEKM